MRWCHFGDVHRYDDGNTTDTDAEQSTRSAQRKRTSSESTPDAADDEADRSEQDGATAPQGVRYATT